MTCQVLQTSTADDTDVVLPGLPLAGHLARAGGHDVTLVFFLHDAAAAERHKRQWEQDARAAGVSDLHVVSITRHYYLPAHLAHAFEAYAWLAGEHPGGGGREEGESWRPCAHPLVRRHREPKTATRRD